MSSWYINSSIYMINLISKHPWPFKFTLNPLFKISCDITRLLKITFLTVKVKKLGGKLVSKLIFSYLLCVWTFWAYLSIIDLLKNHFNHFIPSYPNFLKKAHYLFLNRLKSTYFYENFVLLGLPEAISIYILRYW